MEPQIQVTSNVPFDEQVVAIFGKESSYTQFSASGVNVLAMAVSCIKSVAISTEGDDFAEELYAIVGAMSVVLMNWIISTRAADADQSVRRARKIEAKMIKRISTIPVEELINHSPAGLMKLLIEIAGIVRNEGK